MWCSERTNLPREAAEAALAQTLKDKVEAAYMRSDLLEGLSRLMQAWADFMDKPSAKRGNVVPLNAATS